MAETPPVKRKREEEDADGDGAGDAAAPFPLAELRLRRVLRESARDKAVFLHGEVPRGAGVGGGRTGYTHRCLPRRALATPPAVVTSMQATPPWPGRATNGSVWRARSSVAGNAFVPARYSHVILPVAPFFSVFHPGASQSWAKGRAGGWQEAAASRAGRLNSALWVCLY